MSADGGIEKGDTRQDKKRNFSPDPRKKRGHEGQEKETSIQPCRS